MSQHDNGSGLLPMNSVFITDTRLANLMNDPESWSLDLSNTFASFILRSGYVFPVTVNLKRFTVDAMMFHDEGVRPRTAIPSCIKWGVGPWKCRVYSVNFCLNSINFLSKLFGYISELLQPRTASCFSKRIKWKENTEILLKIRMSLYYFMDSNLYNGCNKATVVGIYYCPYLQKSSIDEFF